MFTYQLAQHPEDQEAVLDLLQQSYSLAYPGSDYRTSISHPDFEDLAVHSVMLRHNAQLTGTISFMYNKQNWALPTPSEFLLGFERPAHLPRRLAEVGRLAKAVSTNLPSAEDALILPMLVWLLSRELDSCGIEGFVGTLQPYLFRRLALMGLQPVALAQTQPKSNTKGFGNYLNREVIYFYCQTDIVYHQMRQFDFGGHRPSKRAACPVLEGVWEGAENFFAKSGAF